MAEPADATQDGVTEGSPPRMPRWVKVVGLVVGILIVMLLVLQLTGVAGQHGPGRHFSGLEPQPLVIGSQPPSGADVR